MGIIGKVWKTKRSFEVKWGAGFSYVALGVIQDLIKMGAKVLPIEDRDSARGVTTFYYLGTERDAMKVGETLHWLQEYREFKEGAV